VQSEVKGLAGQVTSLKEDIIGVKRTLKGMTLPETKRVRRKRTIYDTDSEGSDEQETEELEDEEEQEWDWGTEDEEPFMGFESDGLAGSDEDYGP
jgi:hypothetical protein